MNRYRQGYRAELRLMKMLKDRPEFHTVLRSAGSRSSFDVVAIGERQVLLCQVKTGRGLYKAERDRLKRLGLPRCARAEICIYREGKWRTMQVE